MLIFIYVFQAYVGMYILEINSQLQDKWELCYQWLQGW